jgi:glycosyltransferase involved in cell wall biosynthesis
LNEAIAIFTNSQVVADRLRTFNGVRGEVLLPPIFQPERFGFGALNDEIVVVSRLVRHKRQDLLIEAMRFTKTEVKLRLVGASDKSAYATELRNQVRDARVGDKVTVEDRWISEQEKVQILADCLALAYVPVNEDSYGYPTLEAAYSSKATLTTSDSGGVLEFVQDGLTGRVADPDPASLAAAMDELFRNREATQKLGSNARARVDELKVTWSHVLERLLA